MLKTLIISFNLIGLMLLNALAPKEVKVSHDAPVFATLGEEYTVTVTIDKGNIEGFAKYQVDVPAGMTIEPVEALGASFTFRNGEAKFIWMALPDESVFDISYKLTIKSSAKVGNNDLKHWFSYLEKNERMTTTPPVHVIEVASDDVSNSEITEGAVRGIRKITKLNADHYLVEIDIHKNDIKGFAKLQENLPEGTSAEAVKKASGVFTQLDDKVKVVWFSIPEDEDLKVVYEVFSIKGGIGEEAFTGAFTYLKDNETKTVEIEQGAIIDGADVAEEVGSDVVEESETEVVEEAGSAPIEVETEEVVAEPEEDTAETSSESESGNEPTPEVPDTDDITQVADDGLEETVIEEADEETGATSDRTTTVDTSDEVVVDSFSDITSTPSPDKGVTYRVQIMAGHNVVDDKFVAKKYRFRQPFDLENHEGWVKYTTGSHVIYKEARDSRVKINDNYTFDGPFVTAYNDGVRITVQEALMISRQKWYQ